MIPLGYAVGQHVADVAGERRDVRAQRHRRAGIQDGLLASGLRVPRTSPSSDWTTSSSRRGPRVPLTTIKQPTEKIGAMAVDYISPVCAARRQARQAVSPEIVVRAFVRRRRRRAGAPPTVAHAPFAQGPYHAGESRMTLGTQQEFNISHGRIGMKWANVCWASPCWSPCRAVSDRSWRRRLGRVAALVTDSAERAAARGATVVIVGTRLAARPEPTAASRRNTVPSGAHQVADPAHRVRAAAR
jgi:hypothetical protein